MLVLLFGTLLSLLAALQVKQALDVEVADRFAFAADQVTIRIEERLDAYALVLRGAAGLFDASEEVTREEWRDYVRKLRVSDTLKRVQGIGFARLLQPDELAAHIAEVRAEGFPDYRVFPDEPREVYTSIVYLEPFDARNRRAFGYDMFSEPVRRAAMIQARDSGRAALTGRVQLVQETEHDVQAGTLMYVPVYRMDLPIDTPDQRARALKGWAYSPYRMTDLMTGILGDWELMEGEAVGLHIYDGPEMDADRLLYRNCEIDPEAPSRFAQVREIDFNGRVWSLRFDHRDPQAAVAYTSAWGTLGAGVALSALLFGLILSISGTRVRAEAIAERLTEELRGREEQLRESEFRWRFALEGSRSGLYDWDIARDELYFSPRWREIMGVHEAQIGSSLETWEQCIHPDERAAVQAALRAYLDGQRGFYAREYRVRHADGHWIWIEDRGLIVSRDADGRPLRMIGTATDITDRKQDELALRAAHAESQRFRDALDYVSSYIYMKDREGLYTFANSACLKLFGATAEDLPGSSDSRFFPAETVRQLRKIDRRVLAGEQTTEEIEVVAPDGTRRVYLEIKTPIRDDRDRERITGLLGISTDITTLKEHERQLERIAHYDALTGLPNRSLLADRLQQAMARARRHDERLAVVYLDLDGFKQINDRFGHAAGDRMLVEVAARMKAVMRSEDTLSRLGGDEFVAVLVDIDNLYGCETLLKRMLEAAAEPVFEEDERLQVSASLGVTFYPDGDVEMEADQLLRQADQAMYQAKLAGKGRFHVFDAERDRSARSHHETLADIRRALAEEEFVLFYQPKVNMRTGDVIGVEALIRWQHPEQGLLPPGRFLPEIEDHPLAVELGEWVIDRALRQLRAWAAVGLDLPVSVNVAAYQLRQPDFVDRLEQLLDAYPDIARGSLELEVLETSALGDMIEVTRRLQGCRALGVEISLDDFGTGYASLTYLKRLPADTVKVDQSFVRDILEDPEDLAILDGILSLAEAFGRRLIAEGVETVELGDMLLLIGCELAQGYGIARPMPAPHVPDWVATWRPARHWATLSRIGREAMPLMHAGVAHRAWVGQLEAYLRGQGLLPPSIAADCDVFERGLERAGVAFQDAGAGLRRRQQEVHQLAEELLALHARGQHDQALARLQELYARRDRLLADLSRALRLAGAALGEAD
ncbi:EAL domain-containing protein [Thioalkalivibrio sp. ALJ16]|uniref:bifunctional diguanylate cyclase/phosphodiesterase n=1 Tax=Thioalkalivibrio sp. ALJ16 TaxID=1158762 RepID=UPI0018CAE8F4|nr:EAL domain-containing protein [Thioalkalivibrio sp. ALJ16]